jgi:hypothetical protein
MGKWRMIAGRHDDDSRRAVSDIVRIIEIFNEAVSILISPAVDTIHMDNTRV